MSKPLTQADYDLMHFGRVLPDNYNRQPLFEFLNLEDRNRQATIYIELLEIKNLLLANRNNNSNNDSGNSGDSGND